MSEIKFALIGCGRVAERHADALSKTPGSRLVAVCDSATDRAQPFGQRHGVPSFTSSSEMYRSVEIDAVSIATPSGDHFPRSLEALGFEKHVIVEKPPALRLEHVEQMISEGRRRDRRVWVAFQNRYNPAVHRTREALLEGRLGKPVLGTVRIRWCRNQGYFDGDSWHGRWATDGGVLAQQAIHHVDILRWFLGEIESVESTCSTRLVDIECEDLCVATLRFKSGALGIIEATTAARPRDFEASVSVLGEKGTVVLGGTALNRIETWEFAESRPEDREVPQRFSQEVPNSFGFGHDTLFGRAVASIALGAPVEIPAEEGLKTLEVVHAVYASHERACRVRLDEHPRSSRLGICSPLPTGSHGENTLRDVQECLSNALNLEATDRRLIAGIIGDRPSQYAKSPSIWNPAFQSLAMKALYLSFDVDRHRLPNLLKALRGWENYLGGSVTVPYKVDIVEHLDEVDPLARQIGAVNTILRTPEGTLVGFNTDAAGGLHSLIRPHAGRSSPVLDSLQGRTVLLMGAGGAGRALAFALAKEIGPGALFLVDRTPERARSLADEVLRTRPGVTALPQAGIPEVLPRVDLLVNATLCGQSGVRSVDARTIVTLEPFSPLAPANPVAVEKRSEDSLPEAYRRCVEASREAIQENNRRSYELAFRLPGTAVVFDAVYSPVETTLLRDARLTGHRTLNGKAMNIAQAAEAMFHRVCRSYLESHSLWTEQTYQRILTVMSSVW